MEEKIAANAQPKEKTLPPEDKKEPVTDESYLGSWKTKEDAEKGIANLQSLVDSQGNELGSLRKQMEMSQKMMENLQKPEAKPEETFSYDKEIQDVQKQMKSLDPIDEDYQARMGELVAKSNTLVAEKASKDALATAQEEFKKALDERDIKTMQKEFLDKNPDFNDPEMQQRIQEYQAKDPMSDSLSAYREIQRDDAMAKAVQSQQEADELRRLLDLKKGGESTGTVMTKGAAPQSKQTKATGKDLDKGMLEAIRSSGG